MILSAIPLSFVAAVMFASGPLPGADVKPFTLNSYVVHGERVCIVIDVLNVSPLLGGVVLIENSYLSEPPLLPHSIKSH